MKRVLFVLLAMAMVAVPANQAAAQRRGSNQTAAQRGWTSNYQEALATARRLDKPLMVVFRCVP